MKFKKRVYGAVSIKSKMANFNADFTGRPKSISRGEYFASDKAVKFPMKYMWDKDGEKVMYIRSYTETENKKKEKKIVPRTLSERYEYLFETEINKKDSNEVMGNLFSCIDVLNFGATFAEGGQNLSITGVVQFNQGMNKYSETKVITQDILSPFKDATSEDAQMTSIGKKIVTDEAHYIYGFSVNPKSYEEYENIVKGFEGYSEEAYEKFKEAALISTTALNTNSKFGCENELGIFVETKEDSKMYLPDISNFIEFSKSEKDVFDLNKLEFLNDYIEEIEKIEIYYNEFLTEIKMEKLNKLPIKLMNIYTKKEVE